MDKKEYIRSWIEEYGSRISSYGEGHEKTFLKNNEKYIIKASNIAEKQFNQSFGGENNDRNEFHITYTQPGFFGYNSWDEAPMSKKDGLTPWINSRSPTYLTGDGVSRKYPVKIGDLAVHVLIGVGSLKEETPIERFEYEINREKSSSLYLGHNFHNTDRKVKPFEDPIILTGGDEFWARLYTTETRLIEPYFLGVSFVTGRVSRFMKPKMYAHNFTDPDNTVVCLSRRSTHPEVVDNFSNGSLDGWIMNEV